MDAKQKLLEIETTMQSPGYKLIQEETQKRIDAYVESFMNAELSDDEYDKKYTKLHLMRTYVKTLQLAMSIPNKQYDLAKFEVDQLGMELPTINI